MYCLVLFLSNVMYYYGLLELNEYSLGVAMGWKLREGSYIVNLRASLIQTLVIQSSDNSICGSGK